MDLKHLFSLTLIASLTACGGANSGSNDPAPTPTTKTSDWETLETPFSASMYRNPYTQRIYLTLANTQVDQPLIIKSSDDEGATWNTRSIGPLQGINAIQIGCITPAGRILTPNGYSDNDLQSLTAYDTDILDYPSTGKIYCADPDIILGFKYQRIVSSHDQGRSWMLSNIYPSLRTSNSFTPVRTLKGTFFVPGTTGILRSSIDLDPNSVDGLKWTLTNFDNPVSSVVYNSARHELIAVTMIGDIYYSTDDGLNWQLRSSLPESFIDLNKGGDHYAYAMVAPEPIISLANDGELVVSGIIDTANNPSGPMLKPVMFSSSDHGKTWDSLPDPSSSLPAPFLFISDNYYWMQLNGWSEGVALRLER